MLAILLTLGALLGVGEWQEPAGGVLGGGLWGLGGGGGGCGRGRGLLGGELHAQAGAGGQEQKAH